MLSIFSLPNPPWLVQYFSVKDGPCFSTTAFLLSLSFPLLFLSPPLLQQTLFIVVLQPLNKRTAPNKAYNYIAFHIPFVKQKALHLLFILSNKHAIKNPVKKQGLQGREGIKPVFILQHSVE
jgi:hypothetical protein